MLGRILRGEWIGELISQHVQEHSLGVRLQSELLEDRWSPAIFHWAAGENAPNRLWSTAANWTKYGEPANVAPGANDNVVFNDANTTESWADIPKVAAVEITGGYDESVLIQTPQGNPSTLEITGFLHMSAGSASLGGGGGQSTVKLTGSSFLTWSAGNMRGMVVMLGDANNHKVTSKLSGSIQFDDCDLDNYGTLTATDCYLKVPGSTSNITNRDGATFSGENFSFRDTMIRNVGSFGNFGSMSLEGDCDIDATYNNQGTIRLSPGESLSPQFRQVYFQFSGVTELYGGPTVTVSGPGQVMNIFGGMIIGDGTVNANLTLVQFHADS
jgi:hypothetical protein